jgi:hypothetical protein
VIVFLALYGLFVGLLSYRWGYNDAEDFYSDFSLLARTRRWLRWP